MRLPFLGIFLALADDSFVLSTHREIGSYFKEVSVSHWLVTGYNLGYSVALPAVSVKDYPLIQMPCAIYANLVYCV